MAVRGKGGWQEERPTAERNTGRERERERERDDVGESEEREREETVGEGDGDDGVAPSLMVVGW